MKALLLLICMIIVSVESYAQMTTKELIEGYVTTSLEDNGNPYKMKIGQMYKRYSKKKQAGFLKELYGRICNISSQEQSEIIKKLSLIELYEFLSDGTDSMIDDLYFQKGEICGLQTGDTVMLKECITGLKLSDNSKSTKVEKYINTLQDYLEQIRNYVPLSKRLDGLWMSDNFTAEPDFYGYVNSILTMPLFILNIVDGRVKLEDVGWATNLVDASAWSGKVRNDDNTYAQRVVDKDENHVYMLWSNEKLKLPNEYVATAVGQTVGNLTGSLAKEGVGALVGNVAGGLAGDIVGGAFAGAVVDMFKASRRIIMLELILEQESENVLKANVFVQLIKIKGEGEPNIKKNNYNVKFYRYDTASNAFWGNPKEKTVYIPGDGLIKQFSKEFPPYLSGDFEKTYKKYAETIKKYYSAAFCAHQMKKLFYYHMKEDTLMKAYLGIQYRDVKKLNDGDSTIVNKKSKKFKVPSGVNGIYVTSIVENWPAQLFGLKEGDIITSIDGFQIESEEQFVSYIDSLNPYDWITVHIRRGKKEIDIQVELTCAYNN